MVAVKNVSQPHEQCKTNNDYDVVIISVAAREKGKRASFGGEESSGT
jgi:hypothetical protein